MTYLSRHIKMPAPLARSLALAAADTETTQQQLVIDALAHYLPQVSSNEGVLAGVKQVQDSARQAA